MKTYKNISEQWGDPVEVTPDDYREQARAFGLPVPEIVKTDDGLFIDGEQVAEAVEN